MRITLNRALVLTPDGRPREAVRPVEIWGDMVGGRGNQTACLDLEWGLAHVDPPLCQVIVEGAP